MPRERKFFRLFHRCVFLLHRETEFSSFTRRCGNVCVCVWVKLFWSRSEWESSAITMDEDFPIRDFPTPFSWCDLMITMTSEFSRNMKHDDDAVFMQSIDITRQRHHRGLDEFSHSKLILQSSDVRWQRKEDHREVLLLHPTHAFCWGIPSRKIFRFDVFICALVWRARKRKHNSDKWVQVHGWVVSVCKKDAIEP